MFTIKSKIPVVGYVWRDCVTSKSAAELSSSMASLMPAFLAWLITGQKAIFHAAGNIVHPSSIISAGKAEFSCLFPLDTNAKDDLSTRCMA